MSLYILDTDILSLYQHDHPIVLRSLLNHTADRIAISTVTIEEQINGWFSKARAVKTPQQQESAATFQILLVNSWHDFDLVAYSAAAVLRFELLWKSKLNVGRFDLRIASIALELGAAVVTRNRRDFGRVPGLVIEDWSV